MIGLGFFHFCGEWCSSGGQSIAGDSNSLCYALSCFLSDGVNVFWGFLLFCFFFFLLLLVEVVCCVVLWH